MSSSSQERSHVEISETLTLALASAFGYWAAYAYEAGFANAFAIPHQLIELRITTILTAISALIISLVWFLNLWDLIAIARPFENYPLLVELQQPALVGFVALPFAIIFGRVLWQVTVLIYSFIAFILVFSLLFPLFAFRGTPGYLAKLQASREVDQAFLPHGIYGRAISFIGKNTARALFIAAIGILLSYALGATTAARSEDFWVINASAAQPQEFVLLRIYGDHSVYALLDRVGHRVGPIYQVGPAVDRSVSLRREHLGRLTTASAVSAVVRPKPARPTLGPPATSRTSSAQSPKRPK